MCRLSASGARNRFSCSVFPACPGHRYEKSSFKCLHIIRALQCTLFPKKFHQCSQRVRARYLPAPAPGVSNEVSSAPPFPLQTLLLPMSSLPAGGSLWRGLRQVEDPSVGTTVRNARLLHICSRTICAPSYDRLAAQEMPRVPQMTSSNISNF